MKKASKEIAVIDIETDPFEFNVRPRPFCIGFKTHDNYVSWWGNDCLEKFFQYLQNHVKNPLIIYAHNGGHFDFFFFVEKMTGKIMIVNSRILKCNVGRHEFRDSFSIVPVPLQAYAKNPIDYMLMKKGVRHLHREEILAYLESDCKYLYELVTLFHKEFGNVLTIGSTAMQEIRKRHKLETANLHSNPKRYDREFRPFFFGGRTQVFQTGIIKGDYKIYDVNSMYPSVMRDFEHPASVTYRQTERINKNTDFAVIDASNYGALPARSDEIEGISFVEHRGIYAATIHEINAGLDTNTLEIHKVIRAYEFDKKISFDKFVDHFYSQRLKAKALIKASEAGTDDFKRGKAHDLFYKLVMNAGFGKWAQDPSDFMDYIILPWDDWPDEPEYKLTYETQDWAIFGKPAKSKPYFNVATAASITGAARAQLLRALAVADTPIYCDTDSIICKNLPEGKGIKVSDTYLGAWKIEKSVDEMAIAGKKLYACWKNGEAVKWASKGVRLEANEIREIAEGEEKTYRNPAPKFGFDGGAKFITRRVKATALNQERVTIGRKRKSQERPETLPL